MSDTQGDKQKDPKKSMEKTPKGGNTSVQDMVKVQLWRRALQNGTLEDCVSAEKLDMARKAIKELEESEKSKKSQVALKIPTNAGASEKSRKILADIEAEKKRLEEKKNALPPNVTGLKASLQKLLI